MCAKIGFFMTHNLKIKEFKIKAQKVYDRGMRIMMMKMKRRLI